MLFDRLLAAEPVVTFRKSPSPDDEIGDLHGILDPEEPGCGAVLPNHLA